MATSWRNKKNYPLGTGSLSADITNSTLSIALNAGQGANFPSATFTITIDEEIILIDSRSTDTLTVNASGRGYDSTTASAHAAQTGVYQYQIAKDFTDIETAVNGIENGTTTLAKVITSGSAANTMTLDDSGTNTVVTLLALYHTSSGTPASGLGAKIGLGAENSAGTSKTAVELQGYLSTVTSTSEDGVFLLQCRRAGSLQDALIVTPGASSVTIGSNQATVTLWNSTATAVNAFGAATTLTMGAAAGTVSFGCQILKSTDTTQFKIQHSPASGAGLIRFSPIPTGTNIGTVDLFRETNTSGLVQFLLKKGDNTNTNIVAFTVGASPALVLNNASGTQQFTFDQTTGNMTMTGDLAVNGGDMTTSATTFNLFTGTVTTANMFQAATTISIGAASGTFTFGQNTGTAALCINGAAGSARDLRFQSGGANRWFFRCDGSTETGSGNTGSAWVLEARADDGSFIDDPITVTRASGGTIALARPVTMSSTLAVNGNTTLGDASSDQTTIRGKPILSDTNSPTSGGTGTAGMITWDTSYLYICTASNTWKRVALTGGY